MAGDPGDERISPGLRAVAEALPVRPGMRALETGGGPGAAARWLARHRPGCHVVAIDGSPKAIGQALATGRLESAGSRSRTLRWCRPISASTWRRGPGRRAGRPPSRDRRPRAGTVLVPDGKGAIEGGAPTPVGALRR